MSNTSVSEEKEKFNLKRIIQKIYLSCTMQIKRIWLFFKPSSNIPIYNIRWCLITICCFFLGYYVTDILVVNSTGISKNYLYDNINEYKGYEVVKAEPFLEKLTLKDNESRTIEIHIDYQEVKFYKQKIIDDTSSVRIE